MLQAVAGPRWVCEGACEALGLRPRVCHVSWPSSACRAGAGTGSERGGRWSSPSTWMPLSSSSGASSPARVRCGGSGGRAPSGSLWGGQGRQRRLGHGDAGGRPGAYTSAGRRSPRGASAPARVWAERVAIMVMDGGLPREEAERLAWAGLQASGAAPCGLPSGLAGAGAPGGAPVSQGGRQGERARSVAQTV
jgi:hypothetical protein